MLLRGMNPQILAMDEITRTEDISAAIDAIGCGVALLATAHGCGAADLERRPIYRTLLAERVFRRVVLLKNIGGRRSARVEVLP